MLARSATIFKWTLYTLAGLVWAVVQAAFLQRVTIWGVIPFLYPLIAALPATFEGPAAGTVYALACGVFCDLLLPSPIPCFYTLILPLVGLAAGLLSQSLIPAGYLCSAAAALPAYILPKNVALMTKHGVYTTSEMMARHEIHMEKYCKLISIEAATLVDMVQHSILHAASRYEGVLCQTILQKKQALPHADCRVETALAESILTLNGELLDDTVALKTALETAPETDGEHMLRYYHDTIFVQMNKVRASIDKLETLVAGDYWPYPRYTDLLFSV